MTLKIEDITDQAALDAAIKAVLADAITGLSTKNDELLGKLKKAKENAAPDDLETLKAAAVELETLKEDQLKGQNEYKKLYEKATEQHQVDLAAKDEKLSANDKIIHQLLVSDGLSKELGARNVNPVLLDAAVNLLAGDVSVIDDNGKRIAKVGEKTLDIYVQEWVNSDVGKNFTMASANSGGGAGGNGESDKQSAAAVHFQTDTWNLTQQAKLSKTDPALYKQLHDKHPTRNASGQQQT